MQCLKLAFLCFLVHLLVLKCSADLGDPYKILNIGRKATLQDIRRAYKELAKEWHPDKSDNPAAEAKFVEMKQAYELLIDPERRKAFDLYGITNEDSTLYKQRHDYSQYGRYASDPFDNLFGSHGGRFHFNDQDISLFHKMSVTTRHFELNLMPKSHQVPHILLFYSDWCFSCMQVAPVWRRLIDSLEPLGIIFNTVHSGHEASLARNIGVHSLPCVVLLLDGNTYVYKDTVFNTQKIVEFVRFKMPYKLITPITNATVDAFLTGWSDNRVRALVMEPRPQPRLRYLITAFRFRKTVAFGFVQLQDKSTGELTQRYKINTLLDTVLLFNEDSRAPVVSVSMSDIPTETLQNIISSNQYLTLPRLSNQEMLDALCPPEWNRPRKKLCVVLVTENTDRHDKYRDSLRRLAQFDAYHGRVRFAYVYREKQKDFVDSLLLGPGGPEDALLRLVILWRRDTSRVMFDWFAEAWVEWDDNDEKGEESGFNQTRQRLEERIHYLLRSTEALSYEAVIKDLLDEHAQGLFSKVMTKLLMALEIAGDHLSHEHILPAVSVVGTVLFILAVGYFMANMVKAEEEQIQREKYSKKHQQHNQDGGGNQSDNNNGSPRPDASYQPELRLHEMRAEKYNGLVRLLKPGCRTIILLCDMQSRKTLLTKFHAVVWPYRKNKTLQFSHATLDRCLGWYRELLELSLPELRELRINPRNCVGTVLALNGHRKYFCVYHAKHPECGGAGGKRMERMTRRLRRPPADPEAGAFLGMEGDSSDDSSSAESSNGASSCSKILLEENLLDGLPNWLDRLFEGTTHRYYVNYWPDFVAK